MQKILPFSYSIPLPLPIYYQISSTKLQCQTESLDTYIKIDKKIKRRIKSGSSKPNKFILNDNGKRIGHWTQEQNQIYYKFLQAHQSQFQMKSRRRTQKIFKFMAKILETRSPDQCRSHHQKMQKKYGTFNKILANLRNQISTIQIYQQFNQGKLLEKSQSQILGENQTNGSQSSQKWQKHDISREQIQKQMDYFQIPQRLQPIYIKRISYRLQESEIERIVCQ